VLNLSLKPDSLTLTKDLKTIKITDFSMAIDANLFADSEDHLTAIANNTVRWVAPEQRDASKGDLTI
jgi:serine/threonine protein kinase